MRFTHGDEIFELDACGVSNPAPSTPWIFGMAIGSEIQSAFSGLFVPFCG